MGENEVRGRQIREIEIKEYPSDDWDVNWIDRVTEDCCRRYEALKRILEGRVSMRSREEVLKKIEELKEELEYWVEHRWYHRCHVLHSRIEALEWVLKERENL